MQEKTMQLAEHLAELRRRILYCLAVFIVTLIGGMFAADYLLALIRSVPPASDIAWHAFSLWDGIRIYIQIGFVLSLVITLPFTMYQLWLFVKPGLHEHERQATLRSIPLAALLFVTGLGFGYFVVFRMAFGFTRLLNEKMGLVETYGASQYFTFMFNILLPVSLMFELPVVVIFLTKIRILNPIFMRRMRRYAYLLLVILGTMMTPPDLVSDLLLIGPMIGLYELSLLLAQSVYRKQQLRDQQWELEWNRGTEGT